MPLDFYLRIGTHAEIEPYVMRRGTHEGVIINANLLEATPGATATIVARLNNPNALDVPYFIDPYTHVFCLHPDYLKSVRKTKGGLTVKGTFQSIANHYGEPFKAIVGDRPLEAADFADDAVVRAVARAVVEYQRNRIRLRIEQDPKVSDLLVDWHPEPRFVLASYFPIDALDMSPEWLDVNVRLVEASTEYAGEGGVGAVLCLDHRVLRRHERLAEILDAYSNMPASSYFVWISTLTEEDASAEELLGLKTIVATLAESGRPVCNLHAGFFSMALSHLGLSLYSHGVGYGERRSIKPATGGGLPPEKFYFPSLHRRLRPTEADDVIKTLGISSPEDFGERVCDCGVCKVIVKDSVDDFKYYAELGPPKYGSNGKVRRYPTRESIERARFHFLLNRARERRNLAKSSLADLVVDLNETGEMMKGANVSNELHRHLGRWAEVLEDR